MQRVLDTNIETKCVQRWQAIEVSDQPRNMKRDLKKVGASLAVVALQRLADPEVRAKIAEQGHNAAEAFNKWRAERSDSKIIEIVPSGVDGPGAPLPGENLHIPGPRLVDRFGARRLYRRIDRLRVSVLSLGEGRPDLAGDLDPVLAALEEVGTALELAANLSFSGRLRAHQRVDEVLNALETGLFEAALPSFGDAHNPDHYQE